MEIFALLPFLFILFAFAFVIVGTIFWICMIVECATKEPSEGNDKLIWILIILLTHWIGALIYPIDSSVLFFRVKFQCSLRNRFHNP